jgi:hypothetical protein
MADRGTMVNIDDPLCTIRGVFLEKSEGCFKAAVSTRTHAITVKFQASDVKAIRGRTVILRE